MGISYKEYVADSYGHTERAAQMIYVPRTQQFGKKNPPNALRLIRRTKQKVATPATAVSCARVRVRIRTRIAHASGRRIDECTHAWRGVAWRGVAWRGVAWQGRRCRTTSAAARHVQLVAATAFQIVAHHQFANMVRHKNGPSLRSLHW